MDEICSKFPHLAIDILKRLDCESLKKCALTSRPLNVITSRETNLWVQILASISKELNPNYSKCSKLWKSFLKDINKNTVIKFISEIVSDHEKWFTIYLDTPLDLILKYNIYFDDRDLLKVLRNIFDTTNDFETISRKSVGIKKLREIALRLNRIKRL